MLLVVGLRRGGVGGEGGEVAEGETCDKMWAGGDGRIADGVYND